MANNGVSHAVAPDELKGIECLLKWLSYIPAFKNGPLPILHLNPTTPDPIDRTVDYLPPKNSTNSDPRWLITGKSDNNGNWISGLFDKDSWQEILDQWALSVITGRARLGGIPIGVITAETRTVIFEIPADPANPRTEFQVSTRFYLSMEWHLSIVRCGTLIRNERFMGMRTVSAEVT